MYHAPLTDYNYLMQCFTPELSKEDRALYDAILTSVDELCQAQLVESNFIGDQQGIQFNPEDHSIQLPKGYQALIDQMRELGLFALEHASVWGGLELPKTICQLCYEMLMSANSALFLGISLTHSACMAIEKNASEELKNAYLPKMVSGQWMGSMCLTESHCGTDLGLIKTKAMSKGDHYLISGQKIWITFGEHDLAENIIHLVLAKLPDAPEGSRGISLFLVPKWLENGDRNTVYCAGVEHKMGTHVSPTCVMQFDEAQGYLIGEANHGLAHMFVMMNDARKTVANQGIALAEIAYQASHAFVKDRRQSRALDPNKHDHAHPADPILHHPDVRRQRLHAKSIIIGLRALLFYAHTLPQDDPLTNLLTPILKSFCTEIGCDVIDHCLQVMGGSGYVKDWHVEQYYRDARIAMIYEGTNGIQALDFVLRKIKHHSSEWQSFLDQCKKDSEAMAPWLKPALQKALSETQHHFDQILKDLENNSEIAAAKAPIYLKLAGYTLVTLMWGKLTQNTDASEQYHTLGKYFIDHEACKIETLSIELSQNFSLITEFKSEDF
ncbi:MAG: acyl-CoA dehydrogenase family protein [Gammaproteobacteria bacterium]|nr:acyl-CoA dehydrogenase family protein [Gammaproteobacteria bacterium]